MNTRDTVFSSKKKVTKKKKSKVGRN
jgi:hypothetical protein